ncbi:translation initiation factor IF-3 [Thermus thermamylovorans]|uniref:Translation initiation factor IF-3 n=1 Tax=Thermus thermamylovorans TaxID=2509362 RepID=A0A4Q9B9M0_9DEIN|nr:translation initiation factor IF-3 [Thermus thermamylovorans]TBH21703.1 translation initiation factor IF-3 [Thermus thermamylovorans]
MREYLVNERIRARQVRVIGPDGQQLGIMDTREALRLAEEQDLDLVLVGPTADPPVARIMDYSKWRYEQQVAEREARKKAKRTEVKAIKFRVKIDDHDYRTKLNHIKRFLEEGHKVKVTIMFRGREMTHPELGERLLARVAEDLQGLAVVEMRPELLGRDMNMLLAPAKVSA